MKKISLFLSIFLLAVVGCEKDNLIVTDSVGNLYDPNVRPAIIYTYPANNSTGTFDDFIPSGSYYSQPSFVLQFNKAMSMPSYSSMNNLISVTGFEAPVSVEMFSASSTTGMYYFRIYRSSDGQYLQYRLGKKYSITVNQDLKDIHGYSLQSPYTFSFTKDSVFQVVASSPKDSISTGNATVTLQFNSEIDESTLSKITISPAVQGNWYINSSQKNSIYFYSSFGYQSRTTYTVTVPTTVKDVYGNTLSSPYVFSFKSGDFRLDYSSPSDNDTYASLTGGIFFRFTGLVNASNLSTAVTISPTVSGSFDSYTGSSYFYFRPSEPLKELTKYTVTIDSTLRSTSGQYLIPKVSISFTTEGFRISEFRPYNYSGGVSRYSNLEITFNSSVDSATVAGGVTISPAFAAKFNYSNSFRRLTIRPDSILAANTQYTVFFGPSLKSKQGNSLSNSANSYSFTTEN